MTELPNLAGVATKDLVESIGNGKFSASYINWSRTLHLLRVHAPGWTPEAVPSEGGSLLHRAPVGAYLMIRFVHFDGSVTPAQPQAVMDHRNNAIPFEKISARDITDTQRRGACMAAAMTFGLAYELWAKMPLESGYSAPEPEPEMTSRPASKTIKKAAEPIAEPPKVSEPGEDPLTEDEKKILRGLIVEIPAPSRSAFLDQFRNQFGLEPGSKVAYAITKKKHQTFIQSLLPEFA